MSEEQAEQMIALLESIDQGISNLEGGISSLEGAIAVWADSGPVVDAIKRLEREVKNLGS